ncbi:MAG: hypothetical protein ACRED0_03975 [Gammaproteobacteria bacterium]
MQREAVTAYMPMVRFGVRGRVLALIATIPARPIVYSTSGA